jgi:phosphate transport system protein
MALLEQDMVDRRHTDREYENELAQVRERVLLMGARVEEMMTASRKAFAERDAELAKLIIHSDHQIDTLEVEIDELCLQVLARRQPVASDLRFIMFAVKIVTDLERIGDLAVNIAKREKDISRFAPSDAFPRMELLAQKVLGALQGALDAFVNDDADRAEQVISGDVEIDALNMHVIADVLASGAGSVQDVSRSLALSSVSRYLERVGDHATNIAEMVIYFVRGSDVRHHIVARRKDT